MNNAHPSDRYEELSTPVYNRQRLLLFFLEQAGGHLKELDLQKLLFLYMQDTDTKHYAFVPFRYGYYSFLAADDLDLLAKRGWIAEDGYTIRLLGELSRHQWALNSSERRRVGKWLMNNRLRGNHLIKKAYQQYPYCVIRSEIKENILSTKELKRIREAGDAAKDEGQILYTLGYEGIQFEDFVNKMLQNGIHLLLDVRQNPLSRKFGFSKSALSSLLPRLGLEYEHLPILGVASEFRNNLKTEEDWEKLFDAYKKALQNHQEALGQILSLLKQHHKLALTCFESDPKRCHRHCISDYLAAKHQIRVRHL